MPPKSKHLIPLPAACLILLFSNLFIPFLLSSYAQDADEPPKSESKRTKPLLESTPDESQDPRGYKIGVNVDLVLMYATVYDKAGRFVRGLKQEDFRVYEDGVRQNIESFSQEDVPASMGIVLDISGSMRGKFEQVKNAALALVRASNPQDELFLIAFNEEVELVQDFTNDVDEIADALENITIMGSTALYDAIYLAVQKAQKGTRAKKAIVLVSDGVDRESYYSLNQMLAKVQESDVQVFVIGFLDPIREKGLFSGWSKSGPEKARDILSRIATETGAKAFFPNQVSEIHDIVAEIASELRNQYSIGYYSTNNKRDGAFRRVKIELVGASAANNKLRHRRGYFAPKAEPPQKSEISTPPGRPASMVYPPMPGSLLGFFPKGNG